MTASNPTAIIQPCPFFGGRGEEALAFYRPAIGTLSDGGTVKMPLAKTFWSPRFGLPTDRFGLGWMSPLRLSSLLKKL